MSPFADVLHSPRFARTGFRACASFALAWLIATPAGAQSLADPAVRAGAASIGGLGTATVVINQTTDKAVIDWRNFSVDAGTSVQFRQPGAGSIALNRVTGTDATRINGSLTGNGQVWLLNPNGILIGAGGRVSVGGLLATTHSISNDDFLAGNYRFDGSGASGDVVNQGAIVADGGYAVLAGNRVTNAGLVQARLGQVVLGAGKSFTVDLVGDKLLSFAVTRPVDIVAASGNLVSNTGVLSAQGGAVVMTARAAAGVVGSVVNTTGLIDATAVRDEGGTIVLDGGDSGLVYAAGLIDASGKAAGQTGGRIGVFGDSIVVGAGALLDASGSAGGGAINVGGGWQGATIDGHASAVRAGVAASATLDASAIDAGAGGEITLWSDVANAASQTLAYGTFLAKGGAAGGDGGRIETSGHYLDTTGARGSAAARSTTGAAGLWLLDPYNVEIVAAAGNSPVFLNPGFETGDLTGWTKINIGGSQTVTKSQVGRDNVTYTAQQGMYYALLGGGTVNTPYGISQDFTGIAGQTFNLYTLFLGRELATSQFNDSVQVTLTLRRADSTTSTTTLYSKDIYGSGTNTTAPWQSQLVTLSESGSYTISATSTNIGDSNVPSQLGFDIAASTSSLNGGFALNGGFQTWTATGSPSKIDVGQITGFLNGGTNVRVTTTGAGSEAGNITVNAAIAKTAGTAATLQLDATNGIIVNQAIGSTSNALNVTFNAGAGGIALNNTVGTNGGTLTLNTTGTTTQMVALTTGALVLNGTGGSHALTNAGNSFQTLSGSTGAISIANSAAATTLGTLTTGPLTIATSGTVIQTGALTSNYLTLNGTGGAYALTNSGNAISILAGNTASASVVSSSATSLLYLSTTGSFALSSGGAIVGSGYNSFGGDATLTTANGITLAAGSQIATAGTLALEGATFTNQSGASAISTSGSGRWLIYSQTPVNDSFGGLASNNNAVWNQTPTSTPPASAPSGNRYIFALSPTITVTPTSGHKTYGDALGSTGRLYTASGLVSASLYNNVFTQDTISGTAQLSSSGDAATANVNSYTLNAALGTLVAPQGYGVSYATGTLTVDKRALILAATTASKVYDGNATSTAAPTAGGLVNNNTVSNLAESYDTGNAGNRTLSVDAGYTVNDGNGGGNYAVSLQAASGSITAKMLTASLTGTVAKTYDGSAAAALASGNYVLTGGVVTGDTVTLNNPTSGTYATKDVGSGKTVSVTGLMLTGNDASNYTVNTGASAGIGSIGQQMLTASLTGSVAKTYDGSTAATLASSNYMLTGTVFSGDTVVLNNPASGTYGTKDVGSGKTVSVTGLSLSGMGSGNYSVNVGASAGIGLISQKMLTASLTGSVAKTYDGNAAATLAAGNYVLANTVTTDNVALNNPANGTYDTRNVGTGKAVTVTGLSLTGTDAANYTVNASASSNVGSIAQRALILAAATASKVYDGDATTSAAPTTSGLVGGDSVGSLAESYDTGNAGNRTLSVDAGYTVNDGNGGGNYAVSLQAASGSITAKMLTASLTGTVAKTYDGSAAAALASGNYVLTGGVVTGDTVTLNNPTSGTYATKDVGSGKTVSVTGLMLTGNDASNYTVNTGASAGIGSIGQQMLTASLTGSVAKTYDGSTAATLASSNYMLTGTVFSGDTVVLNNPASGTYGTKDVGSGKTVSVTGLSLSGMGSGNYSVNVGASAGIGLISQKMLTASLTGSVAKTYDGNAAATLAAGNYVLANTVTTDNVALNNPANGTYDTRNVGTGKAVTVTGLSLTGTDAANYTVNASASSNVGSIAQRALILAAATASKVYDGDATTSAAPTTSGLVGGDSVGSLAESYDTGNAGNRTLSVDAGYTVNDGNGGGNYAVSLQAASGSITAKMLTASLTGTVAKTYDGSAAAALASGNYVLTGGVVTGDTVTLNNPTSGTYATKDVGSGKTVSVTGLMLTGNDASNYTVNTGASAGIGSIGQQMLTASLTGSVAKTYDGSTAATLASSNYMLTGTVFSGDTVVLNNPASGTYGTKDVGSGKTVSVTGLSLSGMGSGNYSVNVGASAGIGLISQKMLTASLTGSVAKTYDGNAAATLAAGNYVLANTVTTDNVALNNPANGTYDTRNVGTGKAVTVTGLSLTGTDAANYTVNASASSNVGSIAQRALILAAATASKVYDGDATTSAAPTTSGLVGGDSVGSLAESYDTGNAGNRTLSVDAGYTVNDGNGGGNYAVSLQAASGSITAKMLTASLTGTVAKTYDGSAAAALASGNYVLTGGVVTGDTVTLNNPTSGTYATKDVGSGKTVSVTGLMLTGNDASNYTVNTGASAGIGSIGQQMLTASLTGSVAKTYDGSTAATLASSNYMLTGTVFSGDTVVLNNPASGTYGTKDVGSGKTVSVTGLSLSGMGSGNYSVNVGASAGIGLISQKMLTASLTGSVAKTYDGNAAATLAAGNYVLANTVTTDNVALNNPANGTYDTRNVGTGKAVTVTGLSLTGTDAANYTVNASASSNVGSIAQRALILAAATASKVYDGDATTSAAPTTSGLVGGDSVGSLAESYDTGNAGNRTLSVDAGYTVNDGNGGGNYAVSLQAASGSITAKMLTASLTGTVAKTYDGSAAAALASGNYVLTGGVVTGDTVTLNNPTSGTYATKDVGSGKTVSVTGLMLTGNDASNYTVNTGASAGIGSIGQQMLTASLTGSVAKTYDGSTAATLASSNYMLTGTVFSGDTVVLNNPASGTYGTKDVGSGKTVSVTGLSLSGMGSGNYSVNVGASAGIGLISQKMLTASLTGSVAKTYDGNAAATLAAGNYVLANTVTTDNVALNNPANGTYDTRNVGTGKAVTVTGLSLTGTDAANYTVNASASSNVGSIAQRALILAAATASKVYDGDATTSAAPTTSGLVGGDSVGSLAESYDTGNAGNRTLSVDAGYTVNDGNGGGNYAVSLQAASGSITAKMLTASLTGTVAKTYDGSAAAALASGNYVLTGGVVTGDTVTLNNPTSGTYATKDVGSGKTVSVTGLMLTGTNASNYLVNQTASAAIGSIAAKALTASLTGNVAKTYDGTTAASLMGGNYVLAGAIQNDDVALNNPATGTYDTRNAGTGKAVAVTGLALSGSDAGNYTVNAGASASIGSIAQRALTAGLTGSIAKTYDGTTTAALAGGNYTLANTVQGDSVALNNPTNGSYDTKNVGTGKTVSVAGLSLTGSDANNYTVNASASAAIGSVTAKALTASLSGSVAKTYDGTTAASLMGGNYMLAGAVQGDSVALNNPADGSYDTKNAGMGKTVSVAGLALTGSDAGNYVVNAAASAAIGSITQRTLTAALAGSVAKTYDGTTTAALASGNYALANTVQGDSVALNNPANGNYDTKNVGTGKTVSVTGLALTGGDAGNYTVNASASAAIGSIAAKALTASLTGNVAKTYDGTTAASLAGGNYVLAGAVQGDSVALNNPADGSYDTRNAGAGKAVTVTGLALLGSDAGNYTVNAGASASIGSIAQRALTAGLTGSVAKTYDGTTTAALAGGNYTLANTVQGDSVALNNPANGNYDTKNAGSGKTVSVTGLALTGGDAGNYTVNAAASAAIGSIAAKALDVQLVGNASRTANGGTAAMLTPDNFLLSGLVTGESAVVTQATGQYASASAGTDITVSTTLAGGDFQPGGTTLLGNYVLPVGPFAGRIGTISPQVMATVVAQPVLSPLSAPVAASIAATPVVPSTPIAGNDGPAATAVVDVPSSVGAPVSASPPSPVASTKPATPIDVADAGDPILAQVELPSDKPATHSSRQSSVSVPIAGGLLTEQRALPPHSGQVPGVDQGFSGSGAAF